MVVSFCCAIYWAVVIWALNLVYSDLGTTYLKMSDSEDTVVCPLCQVRVPAAGGGDALQLHYLTSCSGYDKGKKILTIDVLRY